MEPEYKEWNISGMVVHATEEENQGKFQVSSLVSVKYGKVFNFILRLYFDPPVNMKKGNSISVTFPQDFPNPYFNIGSISCFDSEYTYHGYIYQRSNYISIRFPTDCVLRQQLDLIGIYICQ